MIVPIIVHQIDQVDMRKTNLIIFEGIHGVGKTTLLNELSKQDGVLNLYQDTTFWDGLVKPNLTDPKLYYQQFVSSLKSIGHFINELAKTNAYHTIMIDRFYLSSLFWTIKRCDYINDFNNMEHLLDYVSDFESVLCKQMNVYNIIFDASHEDMLNHCDYDVNLNSGEVGIIKHHISEMMSNKDRKFFINLENVDGRWDISEKFEEFIKSRQ